MRLSDRCVLSVQPGKYDVYCVGMTGMRCLLPSFSKDPRAGIDERVKGNTSLMMCFAEVCLPPLKPPANRCLLVYADSVVHGVRSLALVLCLKLIDLSLCPGGAPPRGQQA